MWMEAYFAAYVVARTGSFQGGEGIWQKLGALWKLPGFFKELQSDNLPSVI